MFHIHVLLGIKSRYKNLVPDMWRFIHDMKSKASLVSP